MFYNLKVGYLKIDDFKWWWLEVKWLSGFSVFFGDLCNYLNVEELNDFFLKDVVNVINSVLFELFEEYCFVSVLFFFFLEELFEFLEVFEDWVYWMLNLLNFVKVCGFDCIFNWLFKEYVELLVVLVIRIFNFFYKE